MIKNFLQRYGFTIGWAALLFGLSSIPNLAFPIRIFTWDDKIHHATTYTLFGFGLMRSIVWQNRINRKNFGLAIIIGVLYGISDEIHQHFVPGRSMDWADAVADLVGVMVGSWIFYQWRKRHSMRQRQIDAKTNQMNITAP